MIRPEVFSVVFRAIQNANIDFPKTAQGADRPQVLISDMDAEHLAWAESSTGVVPKLLKRRPDATTLQSPCGLRPRLHAPQLKPLIIDGLLDLCARELVGRVPVSRDRADCTPGPKLSWQLASVQIAREGTQTSVRL